jgi:hypothetical protein
MNHVEVRQYTLPRQMPNFIGNAGKLREQTGGYSAVTLYKMVQTLVPDALD